MTDLLAFQRKSFWLIFKKWDLRFLNPDDEKKYQESKATIQSTISWLLLRYGMILGVLNIISNSLERPLFIWENLGVLLSLIILPMGVCVLEKYTRILSKEYMRVFIIGLLALAPLELDHSRRNDLNTKSRSFHIGVNMEMVLVIMIFSRISWKISIVIVSLMHTLCILRYDDAYEDFLINFYSILSPVVNIFILSCIAYKFEKLDRSTFQELSNYELSISCFKNHIKDDFPNAMLIFHENKFLFINKEATKMFGSSDEGLVMENLKKIMVESKDTEIKIPTLEEAMISTNEHYEQFKLLDCSDHNKRRQNHGSIHKDFFGSKTLYSILQKNEQIGEHQRKIFGRIYGVYHSGDSEINLEIKLNTVIWESKHAAMILISENRIIEKLKRLKEQGHYKDRLLATVSHDLRTPLNGIIGMIIITLDEITDKFARKTLNLALRSSKLLLYMINDILDFSQISNGKLRLSFEFFDIWDTIKDVSKLIKFQAKQKGIIFKSENLVRSQNTKILSDQNRLKQVLLNLLGNALKFTEKGHIKISLEERVNEREFSRREYVLRVEDTGIGIKKEDIPKLFKLFGKLETQSNSNKNEDLNKNGVGLGLAISQSLVKILNNNVETGEINVCSEYAKGSCFSFPLSSRDFGESSSKNIEDKMILECDELKIEDDFGMKVRQIQRGITPVKEEDPTERLEADQRMRIRVLVVDDDQLNIMVASNYLKKSEQYEFDVAFDGCHAISLIQAKAKENYFYDVILMDCNMPKMDGFQATGIIKNMVLNEQLRNVEIIACTANASLKDYEQCFISGMTDYISKPFTREDLENKIHKVLKRRRMAQKV